MLRDVDPGFGPAAEIQVARIWTAPFYSNEPTRYTQTQRSILDRISALPGVESALAMKYPGELYVPSPRPYRGLDELRYPFHDRTITVTQCGRICFDQRKINLSQVFAGQNVGVKQVSDRIWLVTFMDYDLGFFDDETCRLESAGNPFAPKVLPMSPV